MAWKKDKTTGPTLGLKFKQPPLGLAEVSLAEVGFAEVSLPEVGLAVVAFATAISGTLEVAFAGAGTAALELRFKRAGFHWCMRYIYVACMRYSHGCIGTLKMHVFRNVQTLSAKQVLSFMVSSQ